MKYRINQLFGILKGMAGERLNRESARLLIVNALGVAMLMGMHVFIARILGSAEYSHYTLTLAIAAIAGLFMPLGLNHLLIRKVSSERGAGRFNRIKSLLLSALLITVGLGVLMLLAGMLLGDVIRAIISDVGDSLFQIVELGILLATAQTAFVVVHAALIGARRQFFAQLMMECIRPLLLTAVLVAWLLINSSLAFDDVVIANIATVAVVLVAGIVGIWYVLPLWTARTRLVERNSMKAWLGISIPMLLYFVPHNLLIHLDIVFISLLHDVAENGLYFAAARVSVLVAFPLYAVNIIVSPALSAAYSRGDNLNTILRSTSAFVVPLSALAFIFFGIFGTQVLNLFGEEFVGAYPAMMIIAGGYFILAVLGPVDMALTMTRHEKLSALIMMGGVMVDVSLNLILIPMYGMVGAAMATAISLVFVRAIFAVLAWRLLGASVYGLPAMFKKTAKHSGGRFDDD